MLQAAPDERSGVSTSVEEGVHFVRWVVVHVDAACAINVVDIRVVAVASDTRKGP